MKTFLGVVMAFVLLTVKGEKRNNGHCVQNSCFTVHTDSVDFISANKSCASKGGHLLTVRTKETNDVISDLLTGLSGLFWVGLIHAVDSCSDSSLELKGYMWVTGDSATSFKNWKSNKPVCSRQCVSLSKEDPQWTERNCNDAKNTQGYLCEYKNTDKCGPLASGSKVLYETPFGFSSSDLKEVPNGSNATNLDLGTKHICLWGGWHKAPWSCEVFNGGCEQRCNQWNGTNICTCTPGYKLESNEITCKKIISAMSSDPCQNAGCSHSCLTKGQGYECLCNHGYSLDKDGKTCKDINDCVDDRLCPGENSKCFNTDGGFKCDCKSGFIKERDTCVNEDECASGPCDHECVDTEGSYYCECWNGFQVSSEDRHKCVLHCPDWECLAIDCDPNNIFQCNCPRGFILEERTEGLFCIDINECDMAYCDQHCNNTIGSYICSCDKGFTLIDNITCIKTTKETGTTATFDIFTPTSGTPTDPPTSMTAGGLLGIIVLVVAVILLMVCLVCHCIRYCGKTDNVTLHKDYSENMNDLQQVTTEKYTKKMSLNNIHLNHN